MVEDKTQLSFSASPKLVKRLKEAAEHEDRSLSNFIAYTLEQAMDSYKL